MKMFECEQISRIINLKILNLIILSCWLTFGNLKTSLRINNFLVKNLGIFVETLEIFLSESVYS